MSTSALRKRLTRSREPSNDDVAEVAIELQRADRRPAARGQAHQLAVGAGDVDQVGRAVVREAARRRADRAPRHRDRLARVERDDRAAVAQRDVNTPGGVFDHAPRLVARFQRHRRADGARRQVDDVDAIAIGIGGDRGLAVRQHAQCAAAHGGRCGWPASPSPPGWGDRGGRGPGTSWWARRRSPVLPPRCTRCSIDPPRPPPRPAEPVPAVVPPRPGRRCLPLPVPEAPRSPVPAVPRPARRRRRCRSRRSPSCRVDAGRPEAARERVASDRRRQHAQRHAYKHPRSPSRAHASKGATSRPMRSQIKRRGTSDGRQLSTSKQAEIGSFRREGHMGSGIHVGIDLGTSNSAIALVRRRRRLGRRQRRRRDADPVGGPHRRPGRPDGWPARGPGPGRRSGEHARRVEAADGDRRAAVVRGGAARRCCPRSCPRR